MRKVLSFVLVVVLAASSVLWAESTTAQSIPKPSVPEFTLKLVDNSHDVAPTTTTTIDQYTGKQTVTTQPGYHVTDRSIEVWIKNQPFTPYEANSTWVNLYYNVRTKGQYGQDWTTIYSENYPIISTQDPLGTITEYTILKLPDYSEGATVEFQVEAFLGHTVYATLPNKPITAFDTKFEIIESSGWSNTQTITISGSGATAAPSTSPAQTSSTPTATWPKEKSTATPTQPDTQTGVLFGLDWQTVAISVLVVVVGVLAVGMVLLWRRKPAG